MDYDLADQAGFFNEPGVLLTDAVIFAFGGSHLELGEHMLGKEYFPNDNLQMSVSLKTNLLNYYHFLTAYQNLLRDGGAFNFENKATSPESLQNWPPVMGSVAVVNKTLSSSREVFHFINFKYANTLNWRDQDGKQSIPTTLKNTSITMKVAGQVHKIWTATPDYLSGAPVDLAFSQIGSEVNIKLPLLKYWSMVVIEY
jgi:dextranase